MVHVDEKQLVSRLHELLESADLSNLTERQLRQTLERELGASLESRKAFIRKEARPPHRIAGRRCCRARPSTHGACRLTPRAHRWRSF